MLHALQHPVTTTPHRIAAASNTSSVCVEQMKIVSFNSVMSQARGGVGWYAGWRQCESRSHCAAKFSCSLTHSLTRLRSTISVCLFSPSGTFFALKQQHRIYTRTCIPDAMQFSFRLAYLIKRTNSCLKTVYYE